MSAARTIKAVDAFENGNFDLSSRLPISAPDHFRLEGFEDAFDGCGVITVALPARGCCQAVFSQDFLIVMRTVLAAAISVVNTAFGWPAQGNGHVQGTVRQVLLQPVVDRPTYHPPRMQVQERAIERHWSQDNGERQIDQPSRVRMQLISPAHFWFG